METTRPPGFPGNPPARMPRAPTPARSPPPRPLRRGEMTFRPTHDVGPRTQCISGLNHAAYGLPVNASRPGSPQAHASLGSGWRPTLAGWDWIPTGFRTRFRRSHHGILSPLTGLSRHTRWCTLGDVMRVLVTSSLLWVAIPADAQQPGIDEPVTARGCLSRARRSDCLAGNCGLVLRTNEKRDQAPGAPLSVSSTQFELIGESELLFELEEHSATRWTSRCGWHGRAASNRSWNPRPPGDGFLPHPRTPSDSRGAHSTTSRDDAVPRARERLPSAPRSSPATNMSAGSAGAAASSVLYADTE